MLKVNVKDLGTVAVLCLQGQIVNGETEILREAMQSQAVLPGISAIILDLARVTIVDARGLGLLLELREQAEARGMRFELMNLTQWVRKVLEISRLDSVFRITAGVEFFPSISRNGRPSVTTLASCA